MCQYPEPTELFSPANNASDVYNLELSFSWKQYDTEMIGTPCSAVISSPATVFLMLNPEQEMDPTNMLPVTPIFNTTPSANEYTVASIFLSFCFEL